MTYKNIITDDIKTIHLLSVTTHDFNKESFTPFQLEQLTDRLLSSESKGYKQIVIDLKMEKHLLVVFVITTFSRLLKPLWALQDLNL